MDSSSKSSSANRAYPYPEDVKVYELVPNMLQFSNYVVWKKQMLGDVITRNGLRGFIDGKVETPPETKMVTVSDGANAGGPICQKSINEDYVAWKRSDELVRQWILSRLMRSMKNKVSPFKTAKETRLNHYLPLYKAAIEGDWKTAEVFIRIEPDAVRAPITPDSETALIVAVRVARRNRFVKKLVDKMSPDDLAIGDDTGRTALHRAAGSGNSAAAELLVRKDRGLVNLETHSKDTPLYYAAARGEKNRSMILWLMEVMDLKTKPLEDIAREVLRDNPKLASFIPENEDLKHPLSALAGNPSSFPNLAAELATMVRRISRGLTNFCSNLELELNLPPCSGELVMNLENIPDYRIGGDPEAPPASNNSVAANVPLIKPIREKKELQDHALALLQFLCEKVIESDFSNADRIFWLPLEQATLEGIPEIVEKILVVYPYAVLLENRKKQSIFQQAIVLRQEKVFNLIHQLEESRAIVLSKWDASNNNALHLAGHAADPQQLYLKAGAAFQMQRELQWFKVFFPFK
ncbi:hypothetical protein RHGRI_022046 [Rhododendron griersonianum]|uniref:Ankyrin repeat family protein n=1 Tax=Rhododendron griersonianum TaxID=479676 RepID=A0AAV6JRL0_9ERIC|nr:hypothetical protein RHGRI_022046 [Rhododendron griersonianum]